MRKQIKRLVSILLLGAMLLSLWGCQQRTAPESKGEQARLSAQSSADFQELLENDPVLQNHIRNNRGLSTQRDTRTAESFRLIVENTESMAGFVSANETTAYQNSLNYLMTVMAGFTKKNAVDALMLQTDTQSGQAVWTQTALDSSLRARLVAPGFYTKQKMSLVNQLEELTYLEQPAFPENGITVVVSNFIEPQYDLSGFTSLIKEYFDAYPYSAACVMAVRSLFQGDFYISRNSLKDPAKRLENFDGVTPFYLVMIGPEQDVRDAEEDMRSRLTDGNVEFESCLYSNSMNQQVLREPLHFGANEVLDTRKALSTTVSSYNTGGQLLEEDSGTVFAARNQERVETLDMDNDNKVSTSAQIALLSTDYESTVRDLQACDYYYHDGKQWIPDPDFDDGEDSFSPYGWDYEVYVLDSQSGEWTVAGKSEKSCMEVVLKTVDMQTWNDNGEVRDNVQQLARVRLQYHAASALSKEKIYRVELRVHLNEPNDSVQRIDSEALEDYCTTSQQYDKEMTIYGKRWNFENMTMANRGVRSVLQRTPNLKTFLTSMENLAKSYQDDTEMTEYLDFIFNIPNPGK